MQNNILIKQYSIIASLVKPACKVLTLLGIAAVFMAVEVHANQRVPPGQWWRTYNNIDWRVSDEFNSGGINLNKWTWTDNNQVGRKRFWLPWERNNQPWKYVGRWTAGGVGYAYVKGLKSTKRGGGFAAKNSTRYGFAIVRCRIINGWGSNWVPAWWATFKNFGVDRREVAQGQNRLEIDLMEAFCWENRYSIHAIAWPQDLFRIQYASFNRGQWFTLGVDYAPSGLTYYWYGNGRWNWMRRIPFTNQSTTRDRINNSHRKNVFWQAWMGEDVNNPSAQNAGKRNDCEMNIDYFLFYPRK